jgi:DNA excision repair protein ERCC-3
LVLKENNFYIESQYPDVLRELLRNPNISTARILDVKPTTEASSATATASAAVIAGGGGADGFQESLALKEDRRNTDYARFGDEDDDDTDEELLGDEDQHKLKSYSFMITQQSVQVIAWASVELVLVYLLH